MLNMREGEETKRCWRCSWVGAGCGGVGWAEWENGNTQAR